MSFVTIQGIEKFEDDKLCEIHMALEKLDPDLDKKFRKEMCERDIYHHGIKSRQGNNYQLSCWNCNKKLEFSINYKTVDTITKDK